MENGATAAQNGTETPHLPVCAQPTNLPTYEHTTLRNSELPRMVSTTHSQTTQSTQVDPVAHGHEIRRLEIELERTSSLYRAAREANEKNPKNLTAKILLETVRGLMGCASEV